MFFLLSLDLNFFPLCTNKQPWQDPVFFAAEVILFIFRKAEFEAVEGKPIILLRIKFLLQFTSSWPY
jgi:hypothetical protein